MRKDEADKEAVLADHPAVSLPEGVEAAVAAPAVLEVEIDGVLVEVIDLPDDDSTEESAPRTRRKRRKPKKASSGQNGAPVELTAAKLNGPEKRVVDVLSKAGDEPMSIPEIGVAAFPDLVRARALSWTRNALRRLVRGSWVIKHRRGFYTLSAEALEQLSLHA